MFFLFQFLYYNLIYKLILMHYSLFDRIIIIIMIYYYYTLFSLFELHKVFIKLFLLYI